VTTVEFVGASGAGKTTLIDAVRRAAAGGTRVVTTAELISDRPGRRWIHHPTAVNLLADVTVLPSYLRTPTRARFVRFAGDRLRRGAPSRFARYNYLREVVRDVGKDPFARSTSPHATVLIDEGPILTAYHLFAYNDAPYDDDDLERFLGAIPLPDRVVHVTAPSQTLVERAMRRPDRRRELAGLRRGEVERAIEEAVELFERLVAMPALRERTITIDTGEANDAAIASAASTVLAFARDMGRAASVADRTRT
jgi:thymidylate kinase